MNKIKKLFITIFGFQVYQKLSNTHSKILNFKILLFNTYKDARLFYKHSMVFKQNTFNKIESRIILQYHGLEKGFLHSEFKYRFGEWRVKDLIQLLRREEVVGLNKKSQIASAYLSMCNYYERHEMCNVDISDYYSREDYEFFKRLSTLDINNIIKKFDRNTYFKNTNGDFFDFSNSRSSVRSFTGEKIPFEVIEKVIELTKNAPSVCNRQPNKVYYVGDKEKIDKVLQIQGGLTGYTDEISQLLIVVSDRNFFNSIGERNQLYVDGGIFLMNLLYSLHYYRIGACPAHWSHNFEKDKQIQNEICLSDSEKVICVVPIGIPKEKFNTTLSLRRGNEEILKIVK